MTIRRKSRNPSPILKAKVAMAATRGDKKLAQRYDVHPDQIQDWENRLKSR